MTRTLSLDLATTCGWASLGGGVVTSGSQCFARLPATKSRPAQHTGEPYAQFHRWLAAKLRDDKPDAIAYEEVMGVYRSAAAGHIIFGFRGILMSHAAASNIPLFGYYAPTVKKFWTGRGFAKKDEMVAATRRRCPDVDLTDDNESDALAVLHLHLDRTGAAVPAA